MKICRVCKEEKELWQYHKHPRTLDGHFSMCRECANTVSRNRYAKLKEDAEKFRAERDKANAKKREKIKEMIRLRDR